MEIEAPRVLVYSRPYQLARLESQDTSGRKDPAVPLKTDSAIRQNFPDTCGYDITGAQTVSGNDINELKISANRFGHVPFRG
jgi:hypothetical protein